MNAIAMVHKMQRLALTSTSNMEVDKCTTIEEEPDREAEGWDRQKPLLPS